MCLGSHYILHVWTILGKPGHPSFLTLGWHLLDPHPAGPLSCLRLNYQEYSPACWPLRVAQKLINQSSCRPPSTPGRGFAFLLFALRALQRGYRDDSVRTMELSLFRLSPAGKEKHHGVFQRTLGLGLSLVFAYRKSKVLCPRKELPYLKAHNSMAVPPCTILSDETNGLTLTSSGCE